MQESPAMELTSKIAKLDPERGQAFAWASIAAHQDGSPVIDKQGDLIPIEELEKAAYNFVLDARVAGEMHVRKGVGQVIESVVFTPEKLDALATDPFTGEFNPEHAAILKRIIPQGWWLGFQITDPEVRKRVRDGEYPEMSIHGSGKRERIEPAPRPLVKADGTIEVFTKPPKEGTQLTKKAAGYDDQGPFGCVNCTHWKGDDGCEGVEGAERTGCCDFFDAPDEAVQALLEKNGGKKLSKAQAEYVQVPGADYTCAECTFFDAEAGTCWPVKGSIDADASCNKWMPEQDGDEAD